MQHIVYLTTVQMAGLDIFTLPARFQPLAVASESSKASSAKADDSRYPKRKRAEVKYYSSDEAEDSTDSESEWVTSKVRCSGPSENRKTYK